MYRYLCNNDVIYYYYIYTYECIFDPVFFQVASITHCTDNDDQYFTAELTASYVLRRDPANERNTIARSLYRVLFRDTTTELTNPIHVSYYREKQKKKKQADNSNNNTK